MASTSAQSSTRSSPAIAVRGLVHEFTPGNPVLNGLELELRLGEMVGLIGPNGAGKSTLMRILSGRLEPSAGEVSVLGFKPSDGGGEFRHAVRLVDQELALDHEQTGRETLRFFARLYGVVRKADVVRMVEETIERFDMATYADRLVMNLSGGMKRRLHVAIGLLVEPQVVFLDEPTAGLDHQGKLDLWGGLAASRDEGHCLVVSSHDLEFVARYCDRVVVVADGVVVEMGRPDRIIERHAKPGFVANYGNEEDAAAAAKDLEPLYPGEVRALGAAVHIDGDRSLAEVAQALDGKAAVATSLNRRAVDLATAFLALTGSVVGKARPITQRRRGNRRGGGGGGGGRRRGAQQ
jgi:ABC-2 type transport system ATP-binding protein